MEQQDDSCDWTVLVNPMSGEGKGSKDWPRIEALLHQYGIVHTHTITAASRHAIELVQEILAGGCRRLILAGGDGFLNEAVNGIFSQQAVDTRAVTLAMIPVGTGNDWIRSHGIPNDYEAAIKIIREGRTRMHDVGKVSYILDGKETSWYFINMCGMGFDAEVNRKVNADRERGHLGPLKYEYHIFTTLFGYDPTHMKLIIDGQEYSHEVFSMNVGIGMFNGGGMKQLPFAVTDDGLFDITIIEKIPRFKVIRNVKKLYDGTHVTLPEIKTYTGRDIEVYSEPEAYIEVDGESMGHTPFRFSMLQQALRVVTA